MKAPLFTAALLAAGALAVAGCASDGRYGYGYGGASIGYGGPYAYGYGDPYYGWYDGYYYPGTGYYVYESSGTRHRWNDRQRDYWQSHRGNHDNHDNWSGYHRGSGSGITPTAPRGSWGSGHWGSRGNGGNHGGGHGGGNHHRH